MAKKNKPIEEEEKVIGYADENDVEKTTDVAVCPSCGATLKFSPEDQVLKCEHCETKIDFNKSVTAEQDFNKLLQPMSAWSDETHVFVCNTCGAKEVLDKDEIAKHCPFCGTTNIVETAELAGLKPNAVVPFKITVDSAIQKFKDWVKKKIFAPREFKKKVSPESLDGMYNPAFTYDANTYTSYTGRLGKYRTYTTRVNGKTVTKRVLEYFSISGTYSSFFDDILVQASTKIDQKTIDGLQPFETNQANEYSKEYIHGYRANQYTKDGIECWKTARKRINGLIEKAILRKYTYDVVQSFNANTNFSDVKFKYVLLPVYVGHCSWHKKVYNFFVSGHNGKVMGKIPLSPFRVTLAVILGLAVVAGAALLVYYNFLL